MIFDSFMLFFFILSMMAIIGAVPVMIVYIGNKSRSNNAKLDSSNDRVLELENRVEELEEELRGNIKNRIENIETIVTENEYRLEGKNTKMIDDGSHVEEESKTEKESE